jgi:cell volume regulation protein A
MILLFAGLIIFAVFSTKISSRFGVPILIVFLGIGMLVGSDVLKFIYFDDAALTRRVADVLLIFIIFEGGFQTKRSSFQAVRGPALILATFGVLATALILGLLIHLFTDFDLLYSLMIGSIISSTDAAAVLMITRQNPIKPLISTTLEVESAANDPMAILLTVAFIEAVLGHTGDAPRFILDLFWKFGGGVVVGFVSCRVARFLFDRLESENRGYYYVLGIGIPLLCYGMADAIGANGIIAVFFGAYRLGNREFAFKRAVNNFLEGVSAFCNVALFLMLGLLVFPSRFADVWQEGVLIALLVMFVARPAAFLLSTFPFRYGKKERLFMIWGGIKGAVPIVLATYPAVYGIDPEGRVFNIVFFAVLLTCLLQGSTLGALARVLKLTVPGRSKSPYSMELHAIRRSDIDMFELEIREDSAAAGKRIVDLRLPGSVLISSIVRGDALIPPKGHTELRPGDLLSVLAPSKEIEEATRILNEG